MTGKPIGKVVFRVKEPLRPAWQCYRRLQQLIVSGSAKRIRYRSISGMTVGYLLALTGTLAALVSSRCGYELLIVYGNDVVPFRPMLTWVVAAIVFIAGIALGYWNVLEHTRHVVRRYYEERAGRIIEAVFGEDGFSLDWGASMAYSSWTSIDALHVDKDAAYLVAHRGVSLCFTPACFSCVTEYEAWLAFVEQRWRATLPDAVAPKLL